MKNCLFLIFLFGLIYKSHSQKNVALGFGVDASLGTKGLGLNDAGIGFHVNGNLFAKHSLQLRIEAGLDKFIGDKLFAINPNGDSYERNPTIKRMIAGPEFFASKKLSVGALYGAVWNNWMNNKSAEDGLKIFLAGHFGKRKKFTPSFSYTSLPGNDVSYFSFGLGFMFYK